MQLTFKKTGKEIKGAIPRRLAQLQARLDKRNAVLDEFIRDPQKVRSYMVRGGVNLGHRGTGLYSSSEISSEELQEVSQLCRRISDIEQEIIRLNLIVRHIADDQAFDLSINDLAAYGFDELETSDLPE